MTFMYMLAISIHCSGLDARDRSARCCLTSDLHCLTRRLLAITALCSATLFCEPLLGAVDAGSQVPLQCPGSCVTRNVCHCWGLENAVDWCHLPWGRPPVVCLWLS